MKHDIIVIGTSAGGVEALKTIVRALPADLAAAILVVMHLSAGSKSVLADILNFSGPLPADRAEDGEEIRPGHIYVAQPDYHLLVEPGQIKLSRGPRENRARPAVDALFRSAARAYGPRVVGIVLTGAMNDGTAGLIAIKRRGGVCVVQDPDEAMFPSMPQSALEQVDADHVLPLTEIGPLIVRLVNESAAVRAPQEPGLDIETAAVAMTNDLARAEEEYEQFSTPSVYACPECHGVLWQVADPAVLRFRCRIGHAYTAESLFESQEETVELALWEALRALEESASLSRRMAERSSGGAFTKRLYAERAQDLETHAKTLRELLSAGPDRNGRIDYVDSAAANDEAV